MNILILKEAALSALENSLILEPIILIFNVISEWKMGMLDNRTSIHARSSFARIQWSPMVLVQLLVADAPNIF